MVKFLKQAWFAEPHSSLTISSTIGWGWGWGWVGVGLGWGCVGVVLGLGFSYFKHLRWLGGVVYSHDNNATPSA